MDNAQREANYLAQNHGRPLTVRQQRQLRRRARLEENLEQIRSRRIAAALYRR